MPQYTPERGALGCCALVTILGGFGAGIYAGFKQASGVDLSPMAHNLLLYAPAGLAAVLGNVMGKDLGRDSQAMEEMTQQQLDQNPMLRAYINPEGLKNFNASQSAGRATVSMALLTGAATAAGYWFGKRLS